jgi:transcriptional regulator with XRE-family HTH domain
MNHSHQTQSLRTVRPRGAAIRRHRTQEGWNRTTLARASKCSPKTIENAENSRPIFLETLRNIARALHVECADLLLDEDDGPSDEESQRPLLNYSLARSTGSVIEREPGRKPGSIRINVSVCVEGDFDEFQVNRRLGGFISDLKKLIESCHAVTPLSTAEGSIIITIEMASVDVDRLVDAFRLDRLDTLRITDIINQSMLDWLCSPQGQFYMISLPAFGEYLRRRMESRKDTW